MKFTLPHDKDLKHTNKKIKTLYFQSLYDCRFGSNSDRIRMRNFAWCNGANIYFLKHLIAFDVARTGVYAGAENTLTEKHSWSHPMGII